jgi:hypothetical protein
MNGKKIVAQYKRRPISGEIFIDVMGRVIGQLRAETTTQINAAVAAVRAEVGLPISKAADLMALTNQQYRALNERPKVVRVPAGRGRSW